MSSYILFKESCKLKVSFILGVTNVQYMRVVIKIRRLSSLKVLILQLTNTLMRYENATVQLVASFHEIHMTAINVQLPKLLGNHLSTR